MKGRGRGRPGVNSTLKMSHLQCVIEVAVCGVLDADGGHSCSGVGDGTSNEHGGTRRTNQRRRNTKGFDILGEM